MLRNWDGKEIPPFLLYPFQRLYRGDLEELGVRILEVDGEETEYISEEPIRLRIDGRELGIDELTGAELRRMLPKEEGRQSIFSLRVVEAGELRIEVGERGFDLDYLLYNPYSEQGQFDSEGYILIHRVALDKIDCDTLAMYARVGFGSYSDPEVFEEQAFEFFHQSLRGPREHFNYLCNKYGNMLASYLDYHQIEDLKANITVTKNKWDVVVLNYE